MAINVTQKDETLKAVIAYCEKQRDIERDYLENVPWLDDGILSWNNGADQSIRGHHHTLR